MNMKWNVGTKIGTGFGLCGILMLVLAVVGYRSASTSLERARWVAHSQQVLGICRVCSPICKTPRPASAATSSRASRIIWSPIRRVSRT